MGRIHHTNSKEGGVNMEPSKIVETREYKNITQKQALKIISEFKDSNIKKVDLWQRTYDETFGLTIEIITQSSEQEE